MAVVKKYLPQLLILLSIWVVYGNTLNHQFAGDDVIVILENDRVQNGLKDIPSFFKNIKSEQTQHRYGYRPIALLSFGLDIELFGQNPFWGHLSNILYYSIACLLVFYFLRLIFSETSPVALLIITLLFAVHPLHTEVVANIKSRDEMLALIFGLLYLIQVWKWKQGVKRVLLALLFAFLGFFSRENMIGFILFGALLPIMQNNALRMKLHKSSISIGVIIILILTYYATQYFIIDNSTDLLGKGAYHEDRFVANPLVDVSILNRILNAFLIIQIAFKLFLLPHPLIHDYGFHSLELISGLGDWRIYTGLSLLIVLSLIAKRWRKTQPEIIFGLVFFLTTIAIYLHVPIPGPDFFAERFLFTPILGLLVACVPLFRIAKAKTFVILPFGILVLFSYRTHARSSAWINNESLYEADKHQLEECARFQYNYASFLHLKYYEVPQNQQMALRLEILSHYEKAVSISERILVAYLDLGSAYMEFGFPEKAEAVFKTATEKYPELSPPYALLGKYYLSQNDFHEALKCFSQAIMNGPNVPEYYYLKAVSEIKLTHYEDAILTIDHAALLNTSNLDFRSLKQLASNMVNDNSNVSE